MDYVAGKTVRWPDEHGPYRVRVDIAVHGGLLGASRIEISREDDLISPGDWRRIPVARIIRAFIVELKIRWLPLVERVKSGQETADILRSAAPPKRGRPVLYETEHWQSVAAAYTAAPGRPVVAVAEHFVVSRALARKWVETCRHRGLIDGPGGSI